MKEPLKTDPFSSRRQPFRSEGRLTFGAGLVLFSALLILNGCNDFWSKNIAIGTVDDATSGGGSTSGDPTGDDDADGISNSVEETFEMDPKNSDSDHDGYSDGLEFVGDGGDPLFAGQTPTSFTRSRILLPADVVRGDPDSDGDGLGNKFETDHGLNPDLRDTDEDGYDDGLELVANSDPFDATSRPVRDAPPAPDGINRTGSPQIDSDQDGLANDLDSSNGTSTALADTDSDGFSDGLEYLMGSLGDDEFNIPNFSVPTPPASS